MKSITEKNTAADKSALQKQQSLALVLYLGVHKCEDAYACEYAMYCKQGTECISRHSER
jgi:hypothetical protein